MMGSASKKIQYLNHFSLKENSYSYIVRKLNYKKEKQFAALNGILFKRCFRYKLILKRSKKVKFNIK